MVDRATVAFYADNLDFRALDANTTLDLNQSKTCVRIWDRVLTRPVQTVPRPEMEKTSELWSVTA